MKKKKKYIFQCSEIEISIIFDCFFYWVRKSSIWTRWKVYVVVCVHTIFSFEGLLDLMEIMRLQLFTEMFSVNLKHHYNVITFLERLQWIDSLSLFRSVLKMTIIKNKTKIFFITWISTLLELGNIHFSRMLYICFKEVFWLPEVQIIYTIDGVND